MVLRDLELEVTAIFGLYLFIIVVASALEISFLLTNSVNSKTENNEFGLLETN